MELSVAERNVKRKFEADGCIVCRGGYPDFMVGKKLSDGSIRWGGVEVKRCKSEILRPSQNSMKEIFHSLNVPYDVVYDMGFTEDEIMNTIVRVSKCGLTMEQKKMFRVEVLSEFGLTKEQKEKFSFLIDNIKVVSDEKRTEFEEKLFQITDG